jgi:spore germination protein
MYKRLSAILFPIAFLALVGAGIWGYQENQQKNAILIKAENQYQRAFHDLSFHMEKLHNELGSSIAVNSTSQDFYKKGLVNVWRISSQAQNEINQLPLTLLPFNETEKFLNHISQFSYRTAVRDLGAKPITQAEKSTLMTLYERSKSIRDQLQGVQNKVLAKNLRWMDVETALATDKQGLDNSIVDGFRSVDNQVSGSKEMDWGPSMAGLIHKNNLRMLSGNALTPEQIKHKAAQFLGLKDPSSLQVVENGVGTDANTYSVAFKQHNHSDGIQMDLTKKGGHVIYFMAPHVSGGKILDPVGAREAATEFLNQHGYQQMRAINYDEYQNVASVIFARVQNNVILYPEKVTVQVALSNGEIVGFQAADYILEHKERKLDAPKLTQDQVKKELDPKFKLNNHSLVLIKNEMNEDVLCHQFIGRVNGNSYRIYINAQTGLEENIELIRPRAAQI